MGALGGIVARSGHPVERRLLTSLSSLQQQIGPDDEHVVFGPGEAFLYRPFLTADDGSSVATRPDRAPNGDLLIWNGRLDNAEALRGELDAPAGTGAAALVHRAFERWEEGALSRILGDFSLALWSPARRRLLLATDVWALRPVFYRLRERDLVFASRCRAVAGALDLPLEPDPRYVASFVIRAQPSDASPLRGVTMLPPAHCLTLDDDGVRVERYWTPDPARRLDDLDDDELEERFRETFREAVACRLSASTPVFSELSGGFDSSSISCMADRLVRTGTVGAPALETLSYRFEGSSSTDETPYISAVEEHLGRTGVHIQNADAPLLTVPDFDATYRPDFPAGQLVYAARNQRVADRMAARGARVLLRGMAGDQVTWGDPGPVALEIGDALVHRRLRGALDSARRWSLTLSTPLHVTLWRGGLWPLLPRGLQTRLKGPALPVEGWFGRGLTQAVDLERYALGPADDVGFALPSQRQQYAAIREMATVVGWEFLCHRGSVDCRFPFLDRRLVELVLAIPVERMLRPGDKRSLARRAMRGILPERVRTRTSKAGFDEAIYRGVARRWSQLEPLTRDPYVARHGLVDRDEFRAALQKVKHGVTVVAPQLTRTFALEFWLRSLDCRQQRERVRNNPPPLGAGHPTKESRHALRNA